MVEGIVFDMDGLLFDSERVVQRSWNIVGERMGFPEMGNHIYHTIGLNVDGRQAYFEKAIGPDFPMESFSQQTREVFHAIADREGVPLKPGAKELLIYAKTKGYKLAVASSSRRKHGMRLLSEEGIDVFFDEMIFGDMVTVAKPDPEIYLTACEQIQVKTYRAIALEDAPNGVKAAYRAHMIPVMVPDLVMPDCQVRQMCYRVYKDLFEVIQLLKKGA